MAPDLVIDVADGLELQSRMLDVEVTGEAALQVIEHPADFAPTDAIVCHDDVCREYRQR